MFTFEHSSSQCQAEEIGHPKLTPDDKYSVLSECILSQFNMAIALLDIRFTTNRFGNQNLIHNGYRFQVKLRDGDRCYWQCSTRICTATINTTTYQQKYQHITNIHLTVCSWKSMTYYILKPILTVRTGRLAN